MSRILRWVRRRACDKQLLAACDELRTACYILVRYVMLAEAEGADVPSEVTYGLAAIERVEEVLGED